MSLSDSYPGCLLTLTRLSRRRLWNIGRAAFTLGTLVVAGCDEEIGDPRDPRLRPPELVTLDSVVLGETASILISRPADLVVDARGRMLVSDLALKSVVRYNRDGSIADSFGRDGGGPGEFVAPTWMALAGDSVLMVRDSWDFRIELFDTRTGVSLPSRRLDARPFTGIDTRGDTTFVSRLDEETDRSFITFSLSDTVNPVRARGRLPFTTYHDAKIVNLFRLSQLAVRGDWVAQAFEVSNWIYFYNLRSSHVDSILLPVARRKGAPTRLLPLLPNDLSLGMRAANHVSQPIELAWLSDTLLAVVLVDPDRTVNQYRGLTTLSVVNFRSRTACVDAVLEVPTDPPPAAAFRGDTLYLLYMLPAPDLSITTTVRRALIDLNNCTWR